MLVRVLCLVEAVVCMVVKYCAMLELLKVLESSSRGFAALASGGTCGVSICC